MVITMRMKSTMAKVLLLLGDGVVLAGSVALLVTPKLPTILAVPCFLIGLVVCVVAAGLILKM